MKTNSYNKVISALKDQSEVAETPVINSVGTYTQQFMELEDAYWPEAHRNPDKMVKLASAAHRLCGLDNITVPFDLVVEAEILGAPINYHDGKLQWPSVKNFKIKEISDITIPSDITSVGRVSVICQAIRALS
jgi:uroporphyrinogen-III decarboxylase